MEDPKVISVSKSGKTCLLYEVFSEGKKSFLLLYDNQVYAIVYDHEEAAEKFLEMEEL